MEVETGRLNAYGFEIIFSPNFPRYTANCLYTLRIRVNDTGIR